MFVYYYAIVELPLEEVELRMETAVGEMEQWADEAYRSGETMAGRMRLGGSVGPAKDIRFALSPPSSSSGSVTRRVTWEATGTPALFPALDGDLTLARVSDDITQVALRGSYQPPLGAVGRILDTGLLHRVAESSVKQFVDRIVDHVALARGRP